MSYAVTAPLNYLPNLIWNSHRGVSKESVLIQDQMTSIRTHSNKSFFLGWRGALQDELEDLAIRCSKEGWDGYDATPIKKTSLLAAIKFIELLPEHLEKPDFAPEPSGDIAIEWDLGKDKIFSVSLSEKTMIYAGIFGGHKPYGEERFLHELPQTIESFLSKYFSKKDQIG